MALKKGTNCHSIFISMLCLNHFYTFLHMGTFEIEFGPSIQSACVDVTHSSRFDSRVRVWSAWLRAYERLLCFNNISRKSHHSPSNAIYADPIYSYHKRPNRCMPYKIDSVPVTLDRRGGRQWVKSRKRKRENRRNRKSETFYFVCTMRASSEQKFEWMMWDIGKNAQKPILIKY